MASGAHQSTTVDLLATTNSTPYHSGDESSDHEDGGSQAAADFLDQIDHPGDIVYDEAALDAALDSAMGDVQSRPDSPRGPRGFDLDDECPVTFEEKTGMASFLVERMPNRRIALQHAWPQVLGLARIAHERLPMPLQQGALFDAARNWRLTNSSLTPDILAWNVTTIGNTVQALAIVAHHQAGQLQALTNAVVQENDERTSDSEEVRNEIRRAQNLWTTLSEHPTIAGLAHHLTAVESAVNIDRSFHVGRHDELATDVQKTFREMAELIRQMRVEIVVLGAAVLAQDSGGKEHAKGQPTLTSAPVYLAGAWTSQPPSVACTDRAKAGEKRSPDEFLLPRRGARQHSGEFTNPPPLKATKYHSNDELAGPSVRYSVNPSRAYHVTAPPPGFSARYLVPPAPAMTRRSSAMAPPAPAAVRQAPPPVTGQAAITDELCQELIKNVTRQIQTMQVAAGAGGDPDDSDLDSASAMGRGKKTDRQPPARSAGKAASSAGKAASSASGNSRKPAKKPGKADPPADSSDEEDPDDEHDDPQDGDQDKTDGETGAERDSDSEPSRGKKRAGKKKQRRVTTKCFTGEAGSDFVAWHKRLLNQFKNCNVPRRRWGEILLDKLDKGALASLSDVDYTPNGTVSYKVLMESLNETYGVDRRGHEAQEQMAELKQKAGESHQDYFVRGTRIVLKGIAHLKPTEETRNYMLKKHIVDGLLDQNIAIAVGWQGLTDFKQACKVICNLATTQAENKARNKPTPLVPENLQQKSSSDKHDRDKRVRQTVIENGVVVDLVQGQHNGPPKPAKTGGKSRPEALQSKQTGTKPARNPGDRLPMNPGARCHNCNTVGHFVENCPEKFDDARVAANRAASVARREAWAANHPEEAAKRATERATAGKFSFGNGSSTKPQGN